MTYYSALHYATKAEAAASATAPVVSHLTEIDTVANNISDVSTVAGVSTEVAALGNVATDIPTVAAIDSDVSTVAGISTDVSTVAGVSSDVNTVAGINTDVSTVATNISDVSTVAGINTDVSTVAAIDTDVSSVASNATDISTVATDIANINAVAADLTNIDNASQYAAEAKQWAIGDPSEPAGNSAKYWAQQAAGQVIPSQTGHSGEFLTTDGTTASWGTIQQAPSTDNITISLNASDELQTIGVINSRDSSTAIKTWSGTKAQYDAIVTKDSNTLYNITDDTDVSLTILEALYPVGSIYITTNAACPLSTLIAGSTWVLVGQDRVLQGAGTRGVVGTILNESLPNIKGTTMTGGSSNISNTLTNVPSGSFETISDYGRIGLNGGSSGTLYVNGGSFDASLSSPTYQDNAPVQPDAYLVNIFRRTN